MITFLSYVVTLFVGAGLGVYYFEHSAKFYAVAKKIGLTK